MKHFNRPFGLTRGELQAHGMAEANAAKVEQATAKRLFTMAKNQYTKAMQKNLSHETIQSKFSTLNKRMEEVMEKHAIYLALSHPDDSDPTEDEQRWLQAIEDEFNESEQSFEEHMQKSSTSEKNVKSDVSLDRKKADRMCQYELAALDASIKNLRIAASNEDTSTNTITNAQAEIKVQFERYRSAQRSYVALIENDKDLQDPS